MLGARTFTGQKARLSSAVSRVSCISRPAISRVHRRAERKAITVQAIFNLFAPKADVSSPKAAELVEELLTVVSSGRPTPQAVTELVQELKPLSIKSPVRSKLLFGKFKVLYSSRPVSGNPVQILEEPDVIREVSEIKSLGLLPGTSTQSGELNGIDNDSYEESFTRLEVKGPLGVDARDVDLVRTVTVVYLDKELRIVRSKGENEAGDGTLIVYQRVADSSDEDDEEESPRALFFGGSKESTATIAERQVRKKMAAEQEAKGGRAGPRMPANLPPTPAAAVAARVGTVKVGTTRTVAPSPAPVRGGTVRVDAQKAKAEAAAKAREDAQRAKEAAAAKEKAEAEKRAVVERAAAIKSLLESLGQDLKEAQIETRDAAKEAKDLEKANASVLKQVAGARQQLRNAAEDVSEVEEALSKAVQARSAAESALKEALAGVSAAQSKAKSVVARR